MIHGKNRIGFDLSSTSGKIFQAFNPATLLELPEKYAIADDSEIQKAMEKAWQAYHIYKNLKGNKKASFLEAIADEIMALGDELVKQACAETGLPEARIISERGRTVFQLRMFSELLKEGSWVEASIDTALPDRQSLPKPDLRLMLRPIGPVVVFSASNFPLAYSTAGGDTASALAAGNPVIVKAHPSHPGTNLLVGEAINAAALKTGMPDGIFSTLYSNDYELGLALVKHPRTKAVGFTGSFNGGMALYKLAMEREEPIPVFAEMGSVNPVILLPEKLKTDAHTLAKTMSVSVTNGAGQFCTNPGLMAAIDGNELENFVKLFVDEINIVHPQTMLNRGIWELYNKNRAKALDAKGVELIAGFKYDNFANQGRPAIAVVKFDDFAANPNLHEEVFGPFSLLVKCNNKSELESFAQFIKGQLTASVFAAGKDFDEYLNLFNLLQEKAGRFIINGPPTGVEVCPSINHGGPFPASTDSRFTSVGPNAIRRFVRPIAYQNVPQNLLPDELKDGNPLNIWRKLNGEMGKA
jgi:2,5-dioxopentanoate dehydrogenase